MGDAKKEHVRICPDIRSEEKRQDCEGNRRSKERNIRELDQRLVGEGKASQQMWKQADADSILLMSSHIPILIIQTKSIFPKMFTKEKRKTM